MNAYIKRIIDLLMPDECVLCRRRLIDGEHSLCLVCQSKLPRTHCELPNNEAENRVFGRVAFVHGTSFCYYRHGGDFASLIKRAKYGDRPWINRNLASLFATELSAYGWPFDIDLIVPVPIHFFRRIVRGYNQTEAIAEGLSNVWNIPVETGCLKKKRYTTSQVKHSPEERFVAMNDTFELKNGDRLIGKHVLLVDDVLTTGSTLEACSDVLTKQGIRISFLTLGLSE